MELDWVRILIEGGSVGVIIALLIFMYLSNRNNIAYQEKKDTMLNTIITNHINHNTEALTQNKDTNNELITTIKELKDAINELSKLIIAGSVRVNRER